MRCSIYDSVVNVLNIITAPAPFEVLLNALALEFVGTIDEEFAQSTWWDAGNIYLRILDVLLMVSNLSL